MNIIPYKNNRIFIILIVIIIIIIICLIVWSLIKKDSFENSKDKKNIVLITEYFVHKNPIRFNEIKNSIDKNNKNKYINKIFLLNENKDDKYYSYNNNTNKIINVPLNKRSTFKNTFELANKLPNGTIVIISNNDISFDDSLKKLYNINLDNTVICLGRRNSHNENILDFWTKKGLSQDSWIFRTPIKIPEETDFYFGTSGCDHNIAYLLDSIGYNLINIPWDIKAYHNHKSEDRKWVKKPKNFKHKSVPVMKYYND